MSSSLADNGDVKSSTMADVKEVSIGNDQPSPSSVSSVPGVSDRPITDSALDDNYNLYKQSGDALDSTGEAKKVLRKVDRRIVPILFLIYLLQYLDKNGINYASVYGLEKGTNLHGQDYSWLGSIFYFGMSPPL